MNKPNQTKRFGEPDSLQSRSSSEARKTAPEFHPLANIFPLIEDAELDALGEDIKNHGLREPVTMFEGKLLDGRNRWCACEAAGMKIPGNMIRQFDPAVDGEPLDWILSKNLRRRHLNESQRAMVAANIANLPAHRPATTDKSANLPTSQNDAAKMLNVGARSVRSAVAVRAKAEPEMKAAVEQGHLTVSFAAKVTKLSADEQRDIAAKAKAGEVNAARRVAKQKARKKETKLVAKQAALPNKKDGAILADVDIRKEQIGKSEQPTASLNENARAEAERLARTLSRSKLATMVVQLQQKLKAERDKNDALSHENLELQSKIYRLKQSAQIQDPRDESPPNQATLATVQPASSST